ncbi:MAG: hypothetical protein ACJ75B_02010 [Flavisolibacter sp.]
MNIINKIFLKLTLLPSGFYRRMGVDVSQLKSILQLKLTMDDRRPGTLQQTRKRKSKKPISLATLGTMFMSVLLGLLYLMSFLIGHDMVTQLTVYFSLFFFMLSATLISDFTSVLIDIRDNYIILPKPMRDSTFIMARFLHIFIHICKIVVPMWLPGFIAMISKSGWAGALIFSLLVLLVTLLAIFFINAVYILILRITTPQKFQAVISYIQIVFAIVIYASYQIFPRMMDRMNLQDFDISTKKGIAFYPIYWFAQGWNVIFTLHGSTLQCILAFLGLVTPFICLYVVIAYLAPSFNNKLAMINSSASATEQKETKTIRIQKRSYADFLSGIFTRGFAEKMGFVFTWKMTSRSRDFKMKVYPSIGYLMVYVVFMFFNNKHLRLEDIASQQNSGRIIVLSALYFTSLLLTMALTQAVYSDKYKASWIYYVSPIKNPGEVILGGAKAAIFKFYIPLVVFITVVGVTLAGPSILPNIVLGLFNELLIATILVYIGNKMFPFSMHQDTGMRAGSFLRSMALLFISVLIAFGHYLIYTVMPAVIICSILSIIATWYMMSSIRNISWEAIRSSYREE